MRCLLPVSLLLLALVSAGCAPAPTRAVYIVRVHRAVFLMRFPLLPAGTDRCQVGCLYYEVVPDLGDPGPVMPPPRAWGSLY
jgi:hypothetical protein